MKYLFQRNKELYCRILKYFDNDPEKAYDYIRQGIPGNEYKELSKALPRPAGAIIDKIVFGVLFVVAILLLVLVLYG
jgi:hypothetical protein